MDQLIKKKIRLVAERYGHSIEYFPYHILITSELNDIKVSPKDKYGFDIEYNSDQSTCQIYADLENVFDVLIELLKRTQLYVFEPKNGALLDITEWINKEGFVIKERLNKLILDLKSESIDYRDLGGNTIEGEYYKGFILLMDDQRWRKSNMFEFNGFTQQNNEV